MSRIEQVMRELSDLRDFYLKVQRRHEAPGPQHTTFAAEDPAGYNANEEERPLPWAGHAKSRAQAGLLRQQAKLGGLKFETYLTPAIADWILERVEKGIFRDPAEAVFVYLMQAKDIAETPELGDTIEAAILSKRSRPLDSGQAESHSWEEVKAQLESKLNERHPAAYWKTLHWSEEESERLGVPDR